jgi:hypothetical protein
MKEGDLVQSMPVRIHDAWRLAHLTGDQRELLIGNPTHIDGNVQQIAGSLCRIRFACSIA